MRKRSLAGAALLLGLAAGLPAAANTLDRADDAVVLTGAALPGLAGQDPARLVAFRYLGGWQQVPLQVDERHVVDFGTLFNTTPNGQLLLTYADDGTFSGADLDATFDADDELVLRAADAEAQAPAGDPAGVLSGTRTELRLRDPGSGNVAWLYLFVSNGSLDPAAGQPDVPYTFNLLSGDYKTTYGTLNGPNPEDSDVDTGAYAVHFSDRWIRDETGVVLGGASGVDLLDRHKNQFAPGDCGRTEQTFSGGAGAFIVNRSGPLRALRGYVGANSGPTTHRIHRFYARRETIETVLRVHAIPGLVDYWDYNPAASGMTYRNDRNPAGVTIDGVPDSPAAGELTWELVAGSQGSIAHAWATQTDIPNWTTTSFYSDDSTPLTTQCTGDAEEWGASGMWRNAQIPNTDPGDPLNPLFQLVVTRAVRYGAPAQSGSFAQRNAQWLAQPLEVTVDGAAGCADPDGDGWVVCSGCSPSGGAQCGDCDESDPLRNPGQSERCDGFDNDCDAGSADGADESWFGQACDGDDSDVCEEGTLTCVAGAASCDDLSGDDVEVCNNGSDDDCDGFTDAADGECSGDSPELADAGTTGWTGTGADVLIGGFIIDGTTDKTVVVRVLAPSVASGNLGPWLSDTTVQLFDGAGSPLASNDDWGSGPDAAAIQAAGLQPGDAAEAALLATLAPGEYTAIGRGAGGTSGFGRIEVIETDAGQPSRLRNLSTRGEADAAGRALAGRFTIRGSSQKEVLIRALGPTLTAFGVPGVQPDPLVQLVSGGDLIAENDDWSDGPQAARVQALGFDPTDPAEAVILITLAPGTYDVIAKGNGVVEGIGLLEVYDPAGGPSPAVWLGRIRDPEATPAHQAKKNGPSAAKPKRTRPKRR